MVFFSSFDLWNKHRSAQYRNVSANYLDEDISIKRQAGLDRLDNFTFEYKIITLVEMTGYNEAQVRKMHQFMAHRYLMYKKETDTFEANYMRIKSKMKK